MTGCAGFIGSNLVDRLLADGNEVVGFDNFSSGRMEFLQKANSSPEFKLVRGDVLDRNQLQSSMEASEIVIHMAANADVRFGLNDPNRDLEQNTLGTFNVLEAMRANGVSRIAFASSGAVYGEPAVFPTPEDAPFPVQTSLYGASKLACEGLISAYCEGYGMSGYIFRFVSILGERYSHGHVFDFYTSLLANPDEIHVLGDGQQRKSYLYVQDCIDAILLVMRKETARVSIYNLGNLTHCTVDDSLDWITEQLGLRPERQYAGGERGWIGDSPFVYLDTNRAQSLGWRPKLSMREAVLRTLAYLSENQQLQPVNTGSPELGTSSINDGGSID